MSEEIRRRKTSDPEMDAIVLISQVLATLDRDAANRVLEWARKRYVEPPRLSGLDMDQSASLSQFMKAVATTADRIGMAKPLDLLTAMNKVADELPAETAAP